MKRAVSIAFVIAVLCSLFLATDVGPVHAQFIPVPHQYAYEEQVIPVIDGKWTTANEWTDASTSNIVNGSGVVSGVFRDKWSVVISSTISVTDYYLIEFFTAHTNNTGDYVELCYDTTQAGGSAPISSDFMIEIPGHNGTALTFVGNGKGWVSGSIALEPNPWWAQLVSISPLNGTNPHWTTEIAVDKSDNGGGIDCNIMVAMYDASNPSAGVQTWPLNASVNNPSTWGDNNASANLFTAPYLPEYLGIGPILLLCSVATVAAFYGLRKMPRARNSVLVNNGK